MFFAMTMGIFTYFYRKVCSYVLGDAATLRADESAVRVINGHAFLGTSAHEVY